MRGPALRGTRAAMYDAIAGSALAREQLREVVHEPSVESALFKLRECLSEAPESCVVKFEQLAQNSLLEPVLYTQNQFRDWFYAQRAKHVVEMREPWSWFSQARYMRRRILFHAGPTNSGKTHSAVERLLQARSGVYCAPIKALASQMWTRINRQVPCDLLIGDERRYGQSPVRLMKCKCLKTRVEDGHLLEHCWDFLPESSISVENGELLSSWRRY